MKKTGILVINETSFIINDGLTFIGRDPVTCSIILANVTISKQHALAIKINDNFYISDLQSTNGTKLEEVSLQPRFCYEIIDNATLTLGDVKCKFIIQEYNAIFKTPTALSKKSAAATKVSLNTTKLVSTNIHDLPTQLEDGFIDCTQQINDKSVEETQILESSIIETPNVSKIRPNISRTKTTDDFIIPETQSENFSPETQKHYEIDESNNSDQFELSHLDISDTQMAEVHDSIIQSPSKHKTENFVSQRKQRSSYNIHNLETQNINEAETQLELGSSNSPKASKIHNLPTQNLPSSASLKTLNIYEMETQQFEITLPKKPSPPSKKNIHEAETQLFTTQFQKYSPKRPTSPRNMKNLHEAQTQVDTQQFEKPQKHSTPDRNSYDTETQILNSQVCDTPRIKITAATDSDKTSINNSEAQMLEDRIGLKINENSGEPHTENDDLVETQFEFDDEPNIETPKLMQIETTHMEKTESEEIRGVKRVIGKNRAINFTQDNSQLTESQSEPEMPAMKKRVIGNSKPINFTQSPTVQIEIDLNETQFDDDIQINNISEINLNTKKSLNTSSFFSDSDNSLKNNIRKIINNFEEASKNSSNTSTPNRSSIEDRSGSFVSNKITKSVETIIAGIPNKVPDDVFVEIQSKSVTNSLNDNISNTSVQHKAYYTTKTINKVVEEKKDNEVVKEVDILKTSQSLTGAPKSAPSTSKTVEDFDTLNVLDDSTQVMDSENCPENGYSSTSKYIDYFDNSTQNVLAEKDAEDLPSPINKQPPFLTFKTPTSVIRGTSTIPENDSIFDQSTLILTNEQIGSPSSNFNTPNVNVLKKLREGNSTFSTPLQVRASQKNVSSSTSNNVEIYDMPTQVMENPSNIPKTMLNTPTEKEQRSEQTDSDLFDMPTQVMTNKSINKIARASDSETPEENDIFDIPTQALGTVTNSSPNKQVKKTSQPGVSKTSNTVETNDIFDIPTQALETAQNISLKKQIIKPAHPGFPEVANIVESHNIFDVPTQAFETVKNKSPKAFDANFSQLSEKLLHDEDLENILNNEPKTPEMRNLAASSSTDDLSINTKPAKRRTRKTFESSTRKMTRKTINRKKSAKLDSGDPKQMHGSSSNQSTSAKDSGRETGKNKTRVDQSPNVDADNETGKVKKNVDKSSNTDDEGTKRNLRGSSNQSTSAKDSDRSCDKRKSGKKSKQSKPKDGPEHETSKDSDNDNKVLERLEMIVTTTKEVINTKLKDKDQPFDRADIGQTSSNRSTRNSRKRSDASTETLERKKRKTSNNKQKLVEENNNTNNEKLIKKQKPEETINLTRKTTNQPSINSTNQPAAGVSTRPVRKSRIPLKFKVDSQSEESCVGISPRKRSHPQITHQSTSESSVSTISSKIQKLGTNYTSTRGKFRVMFTIFRDEEQEHTVKKLGGKVVEKSKEANVLVTNQIKRSVKLLNAISQGIPIVSPRWLDVCKHSKDFVDPWEFLLNDLESEKRFKFRLQESLNIARQNGLLFQGYTALLTKSVPTDLKDILENAGAKCINSWPKNTTDKHIIVSSMEDKSQWPKQAKVIIVAAEAVFSSVVRQKVDLKSYLLV